MDKNNKQSEEILAEIYRNTLLAQQSIHDILPQVEDESVKEELHTQYEEYEKFSSRAATLAKDRGISLKEPNPFKKAMMWGSIKINSMTDNSRAHIAEMMLQGTVMGISALRASAGQFYKDANDEITALLNDILTAEENFEKKWKSFL